MPVYLPTAVVGNDRTLITLGQAGEIMSWFYPFKDHAQQIYQCMPAVYQGDPHQGRLYWCWFDEWQRYQEYQGDSNICVTTVRSEAVGLEIRFLDLVPDDGALLLRQITIRNISTNPWAGKFFLYGDWNMGGIRVGNGVHFDHGARLLVQAHHDATVVIGGDALETWQCGKAGTQWDNNAMYNVQNGQLWQQDLEIGDVNWAFGFGLQVAPGQAVERRAIFALAPHEAGARQLWESANARSTAEHISLRQQADASWLQPGLAALQGAPLAVPGADGHTPESALQSSASSSISPELLAAYRRSLLCLPLLCGEEGVAVAAPEFDPEFISCGGYGYFWPRDGAEYVSGLIDAGYPAFADRLFDWCARHQDPSGLWHQRYFLNGQPGPNWCLPPDMLQIDQVGAVLWAYGKQRGVGVTPGAGVGASAVPPEHQEMIRKAADYLVSRLTDHGVHGNAFDTWESFIGSFTYSNASLYAAFRAAADILSDGRYADAAARVKAGVLAHFVRDDYLVRGFNGAGNPDTTVDSSSLGAIEPFRLLDLHDDRDLKIAEGTLRVIRERLESDWEGGKAIRRFEWDAYVGGVPACVNTLWMARCCLRVAERLRELQRPDDASRLVESARLYLATVLRRTTPTGLLPELMQGPTGQRYWAAPHGWAMASFVSGVLMLGRQPLPAPPEQAAPAEHKASSTGRPRRKVVGRFSPAV